MSACRFECIPMLISLFYTILSPILRRPWARKCWKWSFVWKTVHLWGLNRRYSCSKTKYSNFDNSRFPSQIRPKNTRHLRFFRKPVKKEGGRQIGYRSWERLKDEQKTSQLKFFHFVDFPCFSMLRCVFLGNLKSGSQGELTGLCSFDNLGGGLELSII